MRLDVHIYRLHPKVGAVRMNIQSYLSLKMASLKVDTLPSRLIYLLSTKLAWMVPVKVVLKL